MESYLAMVFLLSSLCRRPLGGAGGGKHRGMRREGAVDLQGFIAGAGDGVLAERAGDEGGAAAAEGTGPEGAAQLALSPEPGQAVEAPVRGTFDLAAGGDHQLGDPEERPGLFGENVLFPGTVLG